MLFISYLFPCAGSLPRVTWSKVSESMSSISSHVTISILRHSSSSEDTLVSLHEEPLIHKMRVTRITYLDIKETLTIAHLTKRCQEIVKESCSLISSGLKVKTPTLIILDNTSCWKKRRVFVTYDSSFNQHFSLY